MEDSDQRSYAKTEFIESVIDRLMSNISFELSMDDSIVDVLIKSVPSTYRYFSHNDAIDENCAKLVDFYFFKK